MIIIYHHVYFSLQVATALLCLEKEDLVHRDVKPDNILVNQKGIFKLCDFGLCANRTALKENGNFLIGTSYYTPPEAGKDPIHDDMWRFGFTLLEIMNGQHPYPHPESLERDIYLLDQWEPTFPITISTAVREIVLRL